MDKGGKGGVTVGGEGYAFVHGAFQVSKDVFAMVEMSCGWVREVLGEKICNCGDIGSGGDR